MTLEKTTFPDVELQIRRDGKWGAIKTGEFMKDKRVVLFGLPGAFTPTCSSSHVPRYQELFSAFNDAGVDDVVCVSVNDAFVMDAWQKAQGATDLTFFPDGNGALTKALDMWVDKQDLGFGGRSWRYAMVVNNGVIEKAFVEPKEPGDPFHVSDADTVYKYVTDGKAPPPSVSLIGRDNCAHCVRAKHMLKEAGLSYSEVEASPQRLLAFAGKTTTPQVFIDGNHIGGADELATWLKAR